MADEEMPSDTSSSGQRGGIMHAIALGCALALALGGIGAAAWRLGLGNPSAEAVATPARPGTGGLDGALEPLDPFIANLGDDDGRRYLKATLQVEFYDAAVPPEFHTR